MNHSKLLSAPQLRQPRKGDLPAVKGSRQGPGNRDLLGHALSQSKQGASDHRPVQAAGLEPTAGPHAMHAFDPVSGGELTPMSTGPAPGFSAGPVQAKKGAPTNQEKAEHFRDLVFGQEMAGQVRTMRDMALFQASTDTALSNEEDRMVTGLERGYSQNSDFFDELFNQQLQAARALDTARAGFLTGEGGEMDDARADFLAKYSRAASEFQGYSLLTHDIGEKTTTARSLPIEAAKFGTQYMGNKARQLKEIDPDSAAILERAHNLIQSDDKRKNPWVMAAEGGQARSPERGVNYADYIRNMSMARDASMSQDWYAANAPKKQSLLSRLFHRRKRR